MNEPTFFELLWNKWFGLGVITSFACGIIFNTAWSFFKWDVICAEHYCEVLNKVIWTIRFNNYYVVEDLNPSLTIHDHAHKMAVEATEMLFTKHQTGHFIIWIEREEKFIVKNLTNE
jgi:hypothetical protein